MILCLNGKLFGTENPHICIDFIEVTTFNGDVLIMDWDSSGWNCYDGEYDARYKGVYFNEEYANGKLDLLQDGFTITGIQFYDHDIEKETETDFGVTISELNFEDNYSYLEFVSKDGIHFGVKE